MDGFKRSEEQMMHGFTPINNLLFRVKTMRQESVGYRCLFALIDSVSRLEFHERSSFAIWRSSKNFLWGLYSQSCHTTSSRLVGGTTSGVAQLLAMDKSWYHCYLVQIKSYPWDAENLELRGSGPQQEKIVSQPCATHIHFDSFHRNYAMA